MSTKTFMTFGSQKYMRCVDRISKEASDIEVFDHIHGFTEQHLKDDTEFWNLHGQFIENNSVGYGFWVWKSYLIQKMLHTMNYGDYLVYCDSGCEVNAGGRDRLLEYFELLDKDPHNYGVISFELEHMEKSWSKRAIFDYFNTDAFDDIICKDVNGNVFHFPEGYRPTFERETIKNTNQFVGGILVMKKNEHLMDLVQKWYSAVCQYHLLDNSWSNNEYPEFIANRHDQSLFSVLRKLNGSIVLKDETYFHYWVGSEKYPFLAKRNKE